MGFVGLGFHDDSSPEELMESRGYALVTDLHVEVPHRRRGAGRALMLALEDVAREAGAAGVILDAATSETFAAARALYRRPATPIKAGRTSADGANRTSRADTSSMSSRSAEAHLRRTRPASRQPS